MTLAGMSVIQPYRASRWGLPEIGTGLVSGRRHGQRPKTAKIEPATRSRVRERDLARGGGERKDTEAREAGSGSDLIPRCSHRLPSGIATNSENDRWSHKRLLTSIHLRHRSQTVSNEFLGRRYVYEAWEDRVKSASPCSTVWGLVWARAPSSGNLYS